MFELGKAAFGAKTFLPLRLLPLLPGEVGLKGRVRGQVLKSLSEIRPLSHREREKLRKVALPDQGCFETDLAVLLRMRPGRFAALISLEAAFFVF